MKLSLQTLGAVVLILAGIALAAVQQPALTDRARELPPELEEKLATRAVYTDPAEVLTLLYDNRMKIVLVDVRDEAEFNEFHLRNARLALMPNCDQNPSPAWTHVRYNTDTPHRKPLDELVASIPESTDAVVFMSNDEARATLAWRCASAMGLKRAYILEGGVNLWLDMFGPLDAGEEPVADAQAATGEAADDTFRHALPEPRGGRWEASMPPDPNHHPLHREFTPRIERRVAAAATAGGCG